MYNQAISKPEQSDQLLFIVRDKSGINKSQIIKTINWVYNVISKIDQIFIIALTRAVANNISKITLHIVLGIDTWRIKVSVQR